MTIGLRPIRCVLVFTTMVPLLGGCSKQGDLVFQCPVCNEEFQVTTTCNDCKAMHAFTKRKVTSTPECANCGHWASDSWRHRPCDATARCDSKYCFVRGKS